LASSRSKVEGFACDGGAYDKRSSWSASDGCHHNRVSQLDYVVLGSPEVLPYYSDDEDILVVEVSGKIPPGLTVPVKPSELEFWLAAINHGLRAAAPSSASGEGVTTTKREKCSLHNGRPPEIVVDVRLFHPAFEDFIRRYHGTEKLENRKAPARNLLVCSAAYYNENKACQDAVTPFLTTLLGNRDLIPLLFELKNEMSCGDADATHQVGLLYCKYWSYKKEANRASCCPTFLLTLMGSWLCVLGTHQQNRQAPTRIREGGFKFQMKVPEMMCMGVPKLFVTLSAGILGLEEFHHLELVSEAQFFPYVTSFTDKTMKGEVRSSYKGCTDPDPNSNKTVFTADTEDNLLIVIKFIERFNETTHCLLAAGDLVPPLRPCGRSIAGEGEYPAGTNLVDTEWPEGVEVPGGLLQFEHDNEMP
ncbi:hypothetical protein BDM02DRAFT_3131401, partial [Thelephora ganbajun]